MDKEGLREYVKIALEYGCVEANKYNNTNPKANTNTLGMCEDVSYFDIFYAKNEIDFFRNIIEKDVFNEVEGIIDKMKDNGQFEEDADITISDLLGKIEVVKEHLDYKFNGEGYYDFWERGDLDCVRIEAVIGTIEAEAQDKELEEEDGTIHIIKEHKREVSDEYVEEKLLEILKNMGIDEVLIYLVNKNKCEILDRVYKSCIENLKNYNLDSGWFIGMYYDTDGEFWDTTPMSQGSFITSQRDDYEKICVYKLEGQCDPLVYDEDLGCIEECIEDLEEFKQHIKEKYDIDKEDDLSEYINWYEYSKFNNDKYEELYDNQLDYKIDEIASSAIEEAELIIDEFTS